MYVWQERPDPVPPCNTWATAARIIQNAVDAANSGDLLLVTHGVYQAGAVAVDGMSNRVAVTKPVSVQSVDGPDVTITRGPGPNGPAAVWCEPLSDRAVRSGFTLTSGATRMEDGWERSESGEGVVRVHERGGDQLRDRG